MVGCSERRRSGLAPIEGGSQAAADQQPATDLDLENEHGMALL